MKKLLCFALMLFLLVLTLASQTVTASNGPQISFSEESWDLGTHPWGKLYYVYHDVTVSNLGDEELIIFDVEPTCHCTTVFRGIYPLVLEPGSSHTLTIAFETGHHTMTENTTYDRTVIVTSNDPVRPDFSLAFKAHVVLNDTNSTAVTTNVKGDGNTIATSITTTSIPTSIPTSTTAESPLSTVAVLAAFSASILILARIETRRR